MFELFELLKIQIEIYMLSKKSKIIESERFNKFYSLILSEISEKAIIIDGIPVTLGWNILNRIQNIV